MKELMMKQTSRLYSIAQQNDTPVYVYDKTYLTDRAKGLLKICRESGTILRYAVKANPHPKIIKLFDNLGLHFDASSEFEAEHLVKLGIKPEKISLSSQQPPKDMMAMLKSGVKFVATSLNQLDLISQSGWQGSIAVRINPGIGSGHSRRTNTGGITSSFGIWHDYLPEVLAWQERLGANINRLHFHIGAGVDSKIWRRAIQAALKIMRQVPTAEILNMGGGYKVARMPGEKEADMGEIVAIFTEELRKFRQSTGREIHLEIEPGTWLVANSAVLLAEIVDIVDTGANGYTFLKLNTGMNDLLRPTLYGAQHSITVLNDAKTQKDYVVVGHNCETGDILTPAPGQPEEIAPRKLNEAKIGDIVAIGGVGAYGAAMRAVGYNSFPSANEIFI